MNPSLGDVPFEQSASGGRQWANFGPWNGTRMDDATLLERPAERYLVVVVSLKT